MKNTSISVNVEKDFVKVKMSLFSPCLTPIWKIGTWPSETDNSEYTFSLSDQLVGNGLFTVPQPRNFRVLTKTDTKHTTGVVPLSFPCYSFWQWPTTCTVFDHLGSLDNDSTSSTVTSDWLLPSNSWVHILRMGSLWLTRYS
jgi:hypothetical protein